MKEDGAKHPTIAHVLGVKHLKVITCFVTRTMSLSGLLTGMLDLKEYGVTKKWVIITEISKEVENNTIARLNAYAKQYAPRRVGVITRIKHHDMSP